MLDVVIWLQVYRRDRTSPASRLCCSAGNGTAVSFDAACVRGVGVFQTLVFSLEKARCSILNERTPLNKVGSAVRFLVESRRRRQDCGTWSSTNRRPRPQMQSGASVRCSRVASKVRTGSHLLVRAWSVCTSVRSEHRQEVGQSTARRHAAKKQPTTFSRNLSNRR